MAVRTKKKEINLHLIAKIFTFQYVLKKNMCFLFYFLFAKPLKIKIKVLLKLVKCKTKFFNKAGLCWQWGNRSVT